MTLLNDRSSNRKKSQPKGQQDSWVFWLLFVHSRVGGGLHQGAWPRARGGENGHSFAEPYMHMGLGTVFQLEEMQPLPSHPPQRG